MYNFAHNLRDECGGMARKGHWSQATAHNVLHLLFLTSSSSNVRYGNNSIVINEAWHHGTGRQQPGKFQQKFPAFSHMLPAGCLSPGAGALLPKVGLHTGGCGGHAFMASSGCHKA